MAACSHPAFDCVFRPVQITSPVRLLARPKWTVRQRRLPKAACLIETALQPPAFLLQSLRRLGHCSSLAPEALAVAGIQQGQQLQLAGQVGLAVPGWLRAAAAGAQPGVVLSLQARGGGAIAVTSLGAGSSFCQVEGASNAVGRNARS